MLPRLHTMFANSAIFSKKQSSRKKNMNKTNQNEKILKCTSLYEERVRAIRSTSGSTWPGPVTLLTIECDYITMLIHGSNIVMPIGTYDYHLFKLDCTLITKFAAFGFALCQGIVCNCVNPNSVRKEVVDWTWADRWTHERPFTTWDIKRSRWGKLHTNGCGAHGVWPARMLSLIHISEPTRQEAISYAVFCLKKKK